MTKVEIINETVNFYTTHPRSVEDGLCVYLGSNGSRCAFSRCATDSGAQVLHGDFEGCSIPLIDDFDSKHGLDALLQEQYKGHSRSFWVYIQNLHDNPDNWSLGEHSVLTEVGQEKVLDLTITYSGK